jgi:predicted nucleic-acid-binding Zn-ribbon protein
MLEEKQKLAADGKLFVAEAITSDEFVRYLSAKHKLGCPACGERSWATSNVPAGQIAALPMYGATEASGQYKVTTPLPIAMSPVAGVFCQNCGFVELFMANVVLKWLRDNP